MTIQKPEWASRQKIKDKLEEFKSIYEKRPIKNNQGGMLSTHMFYSWFAATSLKPDLIVDSGTYKGQSAWLFQKACPSANIISFDVDTSQRLVTCEGVEYIEGDFSQYDWRSLPSNSLAFFDDHQNSYTRFQQCKWFGFKHLIFEDNYPASQGDCYSPKKIFSCSGFRDTPEECEIQKPSFLARARRKIASKIYKEDNRESQMDQFKAIKVRANSADKAMLEKNISQYIEFPPIYKCRQTRWGDSWEEINYPTEEPIMGTLELDNTIEAGNIYQSEALAYTWICYAKL